MNSAYDEDAGFRVMKLRQDRGYSRERLAELANISAKFLYEIEVGKKGFSATTLKNLASVLEVSCDYILNGKSNTTCEDSIAATIDKFEASTLVKVEQLLKIAYEIAHSI